MVGAIFSAARLMIVCGRATFVRNIMPAMLANFSSLVAHVYLRLLVHLSVVSGLLRFYQRL